MSYRTLRNLSLFPNNTSVRFTADIDITDGVDVVVTAYALEGRDASPETVAAYLNVSLSTLELWAWDRAIEAALDAAVEDAEACEIRSGLATEAA